MRRNNDNKTFTVNNQKITWFMDGTKFACEYAGETVTAASFEGLKAVLKVKVKKVEKAESKLTPMPVMLLDYLDEDPRKAKRALVANSFASNFGRGKRIYTRFEIVSGKLYKSISADPKVFTTMSDHEFQTWKELYAAADEANKKLKQFEAKRYISRADSIKLVEFFNKFQTELAKRNKPSKTK